MELTINFCGDSITHGLNHCRPEETFTAKFARRMAEEFPEAAVYRYDGNRPSGVRRVEEYDGPILVSAGLGEGKIHIIRNGVGGETVARALARIDQLTGVMANGREPDYTVVMYGINDAAAGTEKYAPPAVFLEQYRQLIGEIRQRNPQTRIILMTSTYNTQSIEEYVKATARLAEEEGLPCFDLHAFWMAHYDPAAENGGQGDWLVPGDGCHPTPLAAEQMADHIFECFLELLE